MDAGALPGVGLTAAPKFTTPLLVLAPGLPPALPRPEVPPPLRATGALLVLTPAAVPGPVVVLGLRPADVVELPGVVADGGAVTGVDVMRLGAVVVREIEGSEPLGYDDVGLIVGVGVGFGTLYVAGMLSAGTRARWRDCPRTWRAAARPPPPPLRA
jgi:hypothetical protein